MCCIGVKEARRLSTQSVNTLAAVESLVGHTSVVVATMVTHDVMQR